MARPEIKTTHDLLKQEFLPVYLRGPPVNPRFFRTFASKVWWRRRFNGLLGESDRQ